MSAKARLWRLLDPGLPLAGRKRAGAARGLVRTPGAQPRRPRRHRRWRRSRRRSRRSENDEEEEEEVPAARAPRKKAAPRAPSRKSSDKFELPPISVLTAPKAVRSPAAQQVRAGFQLARAGRRARRFRRPRRNRQGPSRSGGDAVRTRARARHQIVARDRPGRRHRAFDERALGARRRGSRPQRHRHRIAEPASRKGLFARIAGGQGRQRIGREASAVSRQEHRRRIPSSSISRACRIC